MTAPGTSARPPRIEPLSLTAFVTLAAVTISGILEIPRILDRWQAMGLLLIFGFLITRYPKLEAATGLRWITLVLLAQTCLVLVLMHFYGAAAIFGILFFILSATAGLYYSFRQSLVWIGLFTAVVATVITIQSGWQAALQYSGSYAGGFFFFSVVANTYSSLQAAQRANEKLVAELNAKNQQLEEYASQVEILAAIEERNRLAREVHDTIGHRLTVSAVQLEGAQKLIATQPEKSSQMITNVRQQVREALAELRQTVGRLREPVEIELSLPQALQRLANTFQESTGLTVSLHVEETNPPTSAVPASQRLTIYRTAQEALTNIHRHAQAQNAWLRLSINPSAICLEVDDDGHGLEKPDLDENDSQSIGDTQSGFGLRGLRERALQLGGEFGVGARPDGTGTRVWLRLPLSGAAAAQPPVEEA
jgi:signal transduction histidine kinase